MLAFLIASVLAADLPDWTQGQTLERVGNTLRVVCTGTGLSLDLARDQASRSCQAEAVRQVQTNIKVRYESVETERETVLHQEISSNETYSGVVCNPEKESFKQDGDHTTVYLRCRFNLAKIRPTTAPEKVTAVSLVRHTDTVTENVPDAPIAQESAYKQDLTRHIFLSSVPGACDTVIINGNRSAKIVRCSENPQIVTVSSEDKELIIRPINKALMPKRIPLSKDIPGTLEIQYENE